MLGMMTRRRTELPQPVRSSSAGLTGIIRSSRAQANRRRRTHATVLLVLPDAAVPLADEPAFRDRMEGIGRRHTDAITEQVAELADLGLVKDATAKVRVHGAAPMFKLYILNGHEAFFGFYPIAEHAGTLHGETVPMYDLVGKEATMFHHETGDDPDSIGGQYVTQAQAWFDSLWATVSHDRQQ
jgi:hypothetical protein